MTNPKITRKDVEEALVVITDNAVLAAFDKPMRPDLEHAAWIVSQCRIIEPGGLDALAKALKAYKKDPVNAYDRPESWMKLDALLEAAEAIIEKGE